MKLLFVSNFYPPHHRGGYGMLCHEVATQLQARGHEITVLASKLGASDDESEEHIYRELELESDINYYRPQRLLHYRADSRNNLRHLRQVMSETAPDAVMVWGMWNLSRALPLWLEELAANRVIYYLADQWPAMQSAHELYWHGETESRKGRLFKRLLRAPARLIAADGWGPEKPRLEHVLVCSQTLKDQLVNAGVPMEHATVCYHGIDPAPYQEAAQKHTDSPAGALRAAFVGTLVAHKGVHTAIEALARLAKQGDGAEISLSVLGSGHPDYEAHLRRMVRDEGLADRVTFYEPIPRAELPEFLARHDALVMPSVYEEPQARISQEAMAAGSVLVATLTGGTREILEAEVNGLAFAPEDADGLAAQLLRLAHDLDLRQRLRASAWETVSQRFTITRMIDELEAYIGAVIAHEKMPE